MYILSSNQHVNIKSGVFFFSADAWRHFHFNVLCIYIPQFQQPRPFFPQKCHYQVSVVPIVTVSFIVSFTWSDVCLGIRSQYSMFTKNVIWKLLNCMYYKLKHISHVMVFTVTPGYLSFQFTADKRLYFTWQFVYSKFLGRFRNQSVEQQAHGAICLCLVLSCIFLL